MKIAINGFGRIGRQAFKIATDKGLEVVAVNDLTRADELAHLLKYDTVYGEYARDVRAYIAGDEFIAGKEKLLDVTPEQVQNSESYITVDGKKVAVYSIKNPAELPWGELGVDVVLECTGVFVKDDAAKGHLEAGAKKVILSAPSKGDNPVPTFMIGVNNHEMGSEDHMISNASCTTNCISPVTRIIQEKFGIEKAIMTTIHAYTADQNLVDGIHKDLRRGRASAQNISPTSTGAAIATTQAIPELKGKFDGTSLRVPVIAGSISDITFLLKKDTTAEEINQVLKEASESDALKGVLAVSEAPLVSSDIQGRTESSIVDLPLTMVVDGNLAKVFAWYDNEWGYSNRLIELAQAVMQPTERNI